MAQIFYEPLARVFTNTGAVGAGYKYYFYTTGTTTPISSYTTQALSTPNAYPVVADSNGRFPPIWLSNLNTTKVVLTDASGNIIETQDPIGATSSTTSLNDLDVRPTSYWGLTTGTATAYTLTANPSISAYSNVQTFFFQPHIANGAAPTIAISGLSALNLKKYTGQGTKVALQVGDLQATQRYEAVCDGVDIVVLNPRSLPINSGVPASLTIAAGVIAVTNVGSSYIIDTESSASSDDLDTINGGNDGEIIYIKLTNAARVINVTAAGNIKPFGGFTNKLRSIYDVICLRYDSSLGFWIAISGSFFANTGISGYTFSGDGAIRQWGFESGIGATSNRSITFPVTYANQVSSIQATMVTNDTTNASPLTVVQSTISTSGFSLRNNDTGGKSAYWEAIGC